MAVGVAAVAAVVLDSVAATDLGPSNQNLCSSYSSSVVEIDCQTCWGKRETGSPLSELEFPTFPFPSCRMQYSQKDQRMRAFLPGVKLHCSFDEGNAAAADKPDWGRCYNL